MLLRNFPSQNSGIFSNSPERTIVDEPSFSKDEKIYKFANLSIGSKYNANDVTNAHFQMIPNFLKYKEDQILIIIVDVFSESEINTNINIIKNRIDSVTNIDVILFNYSFTIDIIILFLNFLENHAIIPENSMIINYVKFMHPNDQEYKLEQHISTTIRRIVREQFYAKYQTIYYQWFGYNELFYNIIYNDSMYPFYNHQFFHSWISTIIQTQQKNYSQSPTLNFYDVSLFKTKMTSLARSQRQKIQCCLNYSIDIQSNTTKDVYFAPLSLFI